MMAAVGSGAMIFIFIFVFWIISSIKILNEYERAVIFRLGHLHDTAKGPGVTFVIFPIDRMVRISLRTIVHDVPSR
jgi:regulator of protease activity HflC (stomatin/prohibitin superfamily)